ATAVLHMYFANTGWFFRYEAYLVALGVLSIGLAISGYLPQRFHVRLKPLHLATAVLVMFVSVPFITRGGFALLKINRAQKNIYDQQYQMGLFLRKFYENESVAVNDIGIINYLTQIRSLDMRGLGTAEIANARLKKSYSPYILEKLIKKMDVKIAVIYELWFSALCSAFPEWTKVGEWKIPDNCMCGRDTVFFYALGTPEKNRLIKHLKEFSGYLPKDVIQSGEYTGVE
ncbi:MAG: hypothetical protein JW994_04475, partial [Candidatus Omnitrophica bacterium]|nr:hypothetical protein [Candidatus Omnitrophota bacterium]